MAVIAAPSGVPGGTGRCAYVAGKRLGSAPLRSRCKRVMRAASRELGAPWAGADVVFVARGKIARARHGKVLAQMRKQLAELGVVE